MVTCKECNSEVKMKINGPKTQCPCCNDIIDFSDIKSVDSFLNLVFIVGLSVSLLTTMLILRTPFFYGILANSIMPFLDRLPFLLRIVANTVIVMPMTAPFIVIIQIPRKWILHKAYSKCQEDGVLNTRHAKNYTLLEVIQAPSKVMQKSDCSNNNSIYIKTLPSEEPSGTESTDDYRK